MESDLEEDSVPFEVRGPDIVKTVTLPVSVRGPDSRDTVQFVVQGPKSGGSLGISENSPRCGENWKESISLCSSGVSSMNSSLTSSGECRDYEEHSDDDDSRLYGPGTESKLSSSVQVHYPPSLSMSKNRTTAKSLDAPVQKADGVNPELKKWSSLYHSIKIEAQFPDDSEKVLSSFSQLSIKGDSRSCIYGGRVDTEESTGAAEKDIKEYRSQERDCEAAIDNPDLMKLDCDHERTQTLLDNIKSFIDQNKISERGKKIKNKSHYEVSSQDSAHGLTPVNSQRQCPYIRLPSAPPSVEVYPHAFRRNQYGNVPEVMQHYNANANTNNGDGEPNFVNVEDMNAFITTYSSEITETYAQVIQGPPSALPHISTFCSNTNMYSNDQTAFPQQMRQFQIYQQAKNNTTQYMNTSNFVSQTEHNELRNNELTNPVVNPPPQIPPVYRSTQEYHAAEAMNHCAMINHNNNEYSNQFSAGPLDVPSLPTCTPNSVSNQGRGKLYYNYQGSGISTRKANELPNSPTTSNIPSSPASTEKSLPSPSSQTSMASPMILQAHSPCPSTPEGNIPNIIENYRNSSLYSSNSSISSGQSSSSAKASSSASPRSCSDQEGTVAIRGPPRTVLSSDYPHPTHFSTIRFDGDIDYTTVKTVQKPNISKSAESNDDDEDDDDDDEEDDDGNTRVHKLAYVPDDEFEAKYKKFMEHDNGSELRRSMNVTNGDKRTPLYIAVIRNNIKAVKYFLDQGADPTKYCYRPVCFGRDNYITYYENVLHLACEKGFEEMVDLLVDHPSKQELVNSRRQGDDKTPLLICLNAHDVYRNRLSIIRKLLRKGAGLNIKETHSGKSPLMLAIEKHEIDFVREELGRLTPDYRRELLEQTDYDGNTCLHFSAQIASRGQPRDNHMTPTHTNLKPLTDEQVQIFNSSLNLDGANIDAQNLDKVKPKDLRRQLTAKAVFRRR